MPLPPACFLKRVTLNESKPVSKYSVCTARFKATLSERNNCYYTPLKAINKLRLTSPLDLTSWVSPMVGRGALEIKGACSSANIKQRHYH